MGNRIEDKIISRVINESVDGGTPMSYSVHFTSERVMLLFGVSPEPHRDALRYLIEEQTSGEWKDDHELAEEMGAKMAVGLPGCLEQLRTRLYAASSKNSAD